MGSPVQEVVNEVDSPSTDSRCKSPSEESPLFMPYYEMLDLLRVALSAATIRTLSESESRSTVVEELPGRVKTAAVIGVEEHFS